MIKQRHQLFVVLLSIMDALVVIGACVLAWQVRRSIGGTGHETGWLDVIQSTMVLPAVPLVLASLVAAKLYRPRRDQSLLGEQVRIVRASVISVVALFVLLWLMGTDPFNTVPGASALHDAGPRIQFGALIVLLIAMLGAWRLTFRMTLQQLRKRGFNLRHVAIIGTGRLGQITGRTLLRNSWTGLHIAYFISHHDNSIRERCLQHPVLGGLESLEATLESTPVDVLYVAMPHSKAVELRDVLRRLERFAVDVRIIPDVTPRNMPMAMTTSELDGMPVLSYRESPLSGMNGVLKRGLDLVGASIGVVIFLPFMLLIAALVRLESEGPAIFKQRRVGLGGEEFWIYKFRTMTTMEQEDQPGWTSRDDPRVTRFGGWLRKTSLDELPQLFNVLKGEMSLVGPRPERPELISRFREDWRGYMLRQHVKAGMTGWAQVNGLRGDTSLRKRLQYDLFYIRHWSLQLDLRILIMTVFRGFIHPNAH